MLYHILLGCAMLQVSMQTRLRYRSSSCDTGSDADRFDCFPDSNPTEQACLQRGCCWHAPQTHSGAPSCYFPSNYPTYTVTNVSINGSLTTLSLYNPANSYWPRTIHNLTAEMYSYSGGIKRVRIYDPHNRRYEVPIPLFNGVEPPLERHPARVEAHGQHISVRTADGRVLFSMPAPLIYTDQFIQFSLAVSGQYVYGLGELVAPFQKNLSNWQRYSLYNCDQGPLPGGDLYGSHPFALVLNESGSAHGLFLLNSNAMDIDLTPYPAITFCTIGGIIDMFVFEGPTPTQVIQQYHSVIPKPAMPPYWALGYHLCRWGFVNDTNLMAVIQRTLDGGFPYDVQWVDIDHMDNFLDWTVDPVNFRNLSKIVDYLHSLNIHFVNIIDPAVSNQQPAGTYQPYDEGHAKGLFIQGIDGKEMVGSGWPGNAVFPDYSNESALDYFYNQAAAFRSQIKFDGLWLDMNEPSTFVDGSHSGCPNTSLDYPPYVPALNHKSLRAGTLCPSAKQALSSHYNLHNLYGYFESKTAYNALLRLIPNKRPFILTRSTFPSSGSYAAKWTGDIQSSWEDLRRSIPQILNFNMFGVPLTGADVCGFVSNTTEEMCIRWIQLGSFYPFMRSHNGNNNSPKDPAYWSKEAQSYMRAVMLARYELLPYLYTLVFRAHLNGSMVAQPLFFSFPDDAIAQTIDSQFLWGDALMISPVVESGVSERPVYFPNATWYTGDGVATGLRKTWFNVSAPISVIPLHLRGGRIIPGQIPATTTAASRMNPLFLIVSLDEYTQTAEGELFLDDGETQGTVEAGRYLLIKFYSTSNTIKSIIDYVGYKPTTSTSLEVVTVLGVKNKPAQVTVNDVPAQFLYEGQKLIIQGFIVDLTMPAKIAWF